jgi:mannose-6-phosphate isomerase
MMRQAPRLYPLLFEPSLHPKVWGGRQLATRLGKVLPGDQPIGESWEIFWKNRISNGPLRGKTLGELIDAYPRKMLSIPNADPEFPLLVKFLDAQDWLSVQVHPDDERAALLEGEARGKTECWYIIDATPGAQIAYGLAEALDAHSFRKAIEAGRTKDVLQYVTVAPGDFIYVPAGTLHALGPGILLYELQQTSDTTYRVYDWDRPGLDGKPRELHLDKALSCTNFEARPRAKGTPYRVQSDTPGINISQLVRGPYFSLDLLKLHRENLGSTTFTIEYDAAHLLTVISGHTTLQDLDDRYERITLSAGMSAFVPAKLGPYSIVPENNAEILQAWCP